MEIDILRNYRPTHLVDEATTLDIRRPYHDVGEHLPIDKGFIEIARISLASSTGDVISIRAKVNKQSVRIKVVDEYDTRFIDYKSLFDQIPTQGEIADVIRDMNNEPLSNYYWLEIVQGLELKDLKSISQYFQVHSTLYPNLNELMLEFFRENGYT